jgi:6-phosphofructokinase 1
MRQRAVSRAFVRAGPRARTYFDPSAVRAAIVTCGGLCPGLNNVIRELVDTLTYAYGVQRIYGVQSGYWGFHTPDADLAATRSPNAPKGEPVLLTPAAVAHIHNFGGTMLGSDR